MMFSRVKFIFFFKQKTAYEMRISDWSSDVCSSDLLSSTDPNLQNIPIRTEVGRQIRDVFIAAPGHALMAADYSQIELRLAAHMADVTKLKEAFTQGQAIHAATALELLGEVNSDTHGSAKTVNFSILKAISPWALERGRPSCRDNI